MPKFFFILLLALLNSLATVGQDMTIQQTVNYINSKFLASPFVATFDHNREDNYLLAIAENGMITLTKSVYDKLGEERYKLRYQGIETCYPKDITAVYNDNKLETVFFGVSLACKNGDCVLRKTLSGEDNVTDGFKKTAYISLPDGYTATAVRNAFTHLIEKINSDTKYSQVENIIDPFAPKRAAENTISLTSKNEFGSSNSNIVQMIKSTSGIYEIPVTINNVLRINFIFDSGASDISISPDVALTLVKTGTITSADFVGKQKYQFADGTTATSNVFTIREIQIGNKKLNNVRASISNSIDAPMLLGQSVLQKFGKFTIDNNAHTITIE